MRDAEKIIEEYQDKFGELPPLVITIDIYSDFYLDLMQEAIKTGNKITPKKLDSILETMQYDLVEEHPKFTSWKNPHGD